MSKPMLSLVPKDAATPSKAQAIILEAQLAENAYVAPELLHTVLRKAATQLITFATHKAMQRYRARLYSINRDGIRRYRTIRDDEHMYGLLILRLK